MRHLRPDENEHLPLLLWKLRERELEIQHVHVSLLTTATGQRILEFIVWIFGLVFLFATP